MTRYALLISPRAEAAFFAQTPEVAAEELAGVQRIEVIDPLQVGDLHFICVEAASERLPELLRLSAIQGAFRVEGDALYPEAMQPGFRLHPDFVWGEKYRGKTNELLTQLLINVALQASGRAAEDCRLLDPMCGRGTSLLWAMRYGMDAVGVEQEGSTHRDLHRGLKKWTKLHRQKHKLSEGWIQRANKRGVGKFLDFAAEGKTLRVVTGDTVDTHDLTQRKAFDLLVTDLPYGVEHRAGRDQRSPFDLISEAAPGWAKALAPGGAMAIAFNSYLPKRPALVAAFEGLGLDIIDRPLAHRMSEAILRDVLILKKPEPT